VKLNNFSVVQDRDILSARMMLLLKTAFSKYMAGASAIIPTLLWRGF